MNNSEKIVLAGTVLVLIVGGAFLIFAKDSNKEPESEKSSMSHNMSSPSNEFSETDATDLTGQDKLTINIGSSGFETQNIKITQGTTVTWVNQDTDEHSIMAGRMDNMKSHSASADDDKFVGSSLENKGSYSYQFDTLGSYSYHCSIHSSETGNITVIE